MRLRGLCVSVLAVLAFPAVATAKPVTVAPPGNSAVNQYVESVPTAGGGRPDGSIHTGSGAPGRSGGSGGSGGSSAGSIPATTQRSLNAQGADGQRAAALALATSPTPSVSRPGSGSASGSSGASHQKSHRPAGAAGPPLHPTASTSQGASPLSAVFKALTGSTSSGGLGLLLPIILVVSFLAASVLGIARRRRTT